MLKLCITVRMLITTLSLLLFAREYGYVCVGKILKLNRIYYKQPQNYYLFGHTTSNVSVGVVLVYLLFLTKLYEASKS